MLRLGMILFAVVATSLAGMAIVVSLTMGYDTLTPILIAAAIGFVAAFPVTWIVAKKIAELR